MIFWLYMTNLDLFISLLLDPLASFPDHDNSTTEDCCLSISNKRKVSEADAGPSERPNTISCSDIAKDSEENTAHAEQESSLETTGLTPGGNVSRTKLGLNQEFPVARLN